MASLLWAAILLLKYQVINVISTIGSFIPNFPHIVPVKNAFHASYFVPRSLTLARMAIAEYYSKIQLGEPAPNNVLHRVEDSSECRLLDMAKLGRPLVVNFGSCSWPPFMESMVNFNKMAKEYADIADFVIVYIEEAHPTDGWTIPGYEIEIAQAKVLSERVEAAKMLIDRIPPPCPVLVDGLDNLNSTDYAALPERLFVIKDGIITYHGGPGPFEYSVDEVETYLKKSK